MTRIVFSSETGVRSPSVCHLNLVEDWLPLSGFYNSARNSARSAVQTASILRAESLGCNPHSESHSPDVYERNYREPKSPGLSLHLNHPKERRRRILYNRQQKTGLGARNSAKDGGGHHPDDDTKLNRKPSLSEALRLNSAQSCVIDSTLSNLISTF